MIILLSILFNLLLLNASNQEKRKSLGFIGFRNTCTYVDEGLLKRTSTLPNDVAWGGRARAVVRALAYHQCGPGSIPRSGLICVLSLLVLCSAPRGFLRVLRLPSPQKPAFDLICVNS